MIARRLTSRRRTARMHALLQWSRHGALAARPWSPAAVATHRQRQEGQTLVLFAIFFTAILGMAALVLDQGLLRKTNLDLHNALDSGALAGVPMVKDDPARAEQVAREYVQANFPGNLPDSDVQVSFRCLIGVDSGAPRLTDVPTVCDPGPFATWKLDGNRAFAMCNPAAGHVCNVLVVQGPAERDYHFGPAIGVPSGQTPAHSAAACKGLCGEPPEVPIDLVVILDRTGSMSGVDTDNARNAADSVRRTLDPRVQWLSFAVLGPSRLGSACKTQADSSIGGAGAADLRRWVPIGLTGQGASFGSDYLMGSSPMAAAIACFGNSSTGTDIADPVRMATYELENYGRSNAKKAILLLSDGQPNRSTTGTYNYCLEADNAAKQAKNKGIEIFTVGFGLDGSNDSECSDQDDVWEDRMATELLASMATDSVKDGGCPGTENSDGDHYYCLPKTAGASTDLSDVFRVAVEKLTSHSRLVKLPD